LIPARERRLMHEAVAKLDLDLSGLRVLTEAASGRYIYTPLICALAGCVEVIAYTRDSDYAAASEVEEATLQAASELGVAGSLSVRTSLDDAAWGSADIVTNLGFLRPIDAARVGKLKPTAVIPLMFETWEFRDGDLDLGACLERGICVLGTNEELGSLRILDYLGPLVAKKLFERGVEVRGCKVVVVGRGKFFGKVADYLESAGARVLRWLAEAGSSRAAPAGEERLESLAGADAIVAAGEPNSGDTLIGGALLSAEQIEARCPDALVVQLAGRVARASLSRCGIQCIPRREPVPGHMGWSLSELGPRPVIDLHAAGLKVGELLARARLDGLTPEEATARALLNPVCQDFSPEQKARYGGSR